MNKNKLKKTGVGLLASALAITGTYAWLRSSETALKENKIVAGSSRVVFEDGTNAITLTDNLAIPMTNEYAVANLTPYTFKVSNKGTVDMKYSLKAVAEDGTTIDTSLVMLQLDGRTPITLAQANLMSGKKIAAGTSDDHSMIAYISENGTIDNSLEKVVKFHLELEAVQTDMSELPTVSMNYGTMEKSQIATTITAGGETKNVEVYNIEGNSKTELLNKLQESGLANPSDVDALVEVKGEDYDGLNSTATFDVSSVANPGGKVVILHFNEATQEWEYVGEETVAEDSTVSGDFTSYSPIAFVVISNNAIDMTNINITNGVTTLAAGDFSTKGNLVTINDTQYRVLEVNGTQAKVMSMESAGSVKFNDVSVTTSFGGKPGQQYANSILDNTMNSFYETLPETIKNSILEQNITQKMYSSGYSITEDYVLSVGNSNYYTFVAETNVGNRKVYAPELEDIVEFFESREVTSSQINNMFFNVTESTNGWVWLRSVGGEPVYHIYGFGGFPKTDYHNYPNDARPVFVIDLSLLS